MIGPGRVLRVDSGPFFPVAARHAGVLATVRNCYRYSRPVCHLHEIPGELLSPFSVRAKGKYDHHEVRESGWLPEGTRRPCPLACLEQDVAEQLVNFR